jgi:hypothetical protein
VATLQYVVNAIDGASGTFAKIALSAQDLNKKVDDLAKKRADIKVGLDDKTAQAGLKDLDLKLTKMKAKVTDPKVNVKGLESAFFGIGRLDVALDKIGAKSVTAHVKVDVDRSLLNRLSLGAAGKGGGGALSGFAAFLGGGGSAATGAAPGAGAGAGQGAGLLAASGPVGVGVGLIGAGLVPGVAGLGIGGLAGLGAIGGGLFGAAQAKTVLNADLANIKTITTGLKTAIGQQKTVLSQALRDANKQYSKDAAFFQPFTNFQASITGLAHTILIPLRAVMNPLTGIFTQFGKGLAALGPQFTALFRASLPFIDQFLKFMLQAGKILLPAFTQAMNQMVKSGALQQMMQGLVVLTQGLANFIVALGPGMKASAQIFARLMTQTSRVLDVLGTAFTVTAKILAIDFPADVHTGVTAVMASFDVLRHDAAVVFDTLRHDAASTGHDIAHTFDFLRHTLAGTWNMLRADAATAWDTIWRNTVTRVQNGIATVVGFFRGLPARALNALTGLGHSLYAFAHAALNEMWSGFKAVAGSVLKWLGGFVSSIISKVKSLLHIGSPSAVFHDIGVNMMLGLARGIKASAHHAANAAQGAIGGVGGVGGPGGGAPSANAALARSLYGRVMGPADWAAWNYVAMRESGWNQFARNASSGAYGIAQALPPTKYPFAGQAAGGSNPRAQITWMWNYMAQRYGGPQGAAAHERAFNWYGSGLAGGIFTRPTLIGVGERGPERVDITPSSGPGSMAETNALLRQAIALLRVAPAATSAGTARALNGAARTAIR